MGMSREEIDNLINKHFHFEATDDIEGVLASMTDDVRHLVIPSSYGSLQGKAAVNDYYRMLFRAIQGSGVTPLRRLYGENFVVDEVMWHGHVCDGAAFLCEGKSGPVSFRLLHVFEIRDSLISSESVWCDLATIQRQLDVTVS